MRICVFCGSRLGINLAYQHLARQLGRLIAARGATLIYGGAKVGLMNLVANEVLHQGGQVIGILPQILSNHELAHDGLSELIIVDSMQERKRRMHEMSDVFVALPGGMGTLDEVAEMVTLAQISPILSHQKKTYLVDEGQFFKGFALQLQQMQRDGFFAAEHLQYVELVATLEMLEEKLFGVRHGNL